MDEKLDPFSARLDGLTDQEIEARIAAAIWVADKHAFVQRYLEDKKQNQEKVAKAKELELARSAKVAARAALDLAKDAQDRAKLAFTIASVAVAAAIALAAITIVIAVGR
jgi:hypothetical protein